MNEKYIYAKYCEENNIPFQDAIVFHDEIKGTHEYQVYKIGVYVNNVFNQFLADIEKCLKFAKDKRLIK